MEKHTRPTHVLSPRDSLQIKGHTQIEKDGKRYFMKIKRKTQGSKTYTRQTRLKQRLYNKGERRT